MTKHTKECDTAREKAWKVCEVSWNPRQAAREKAWEAWEAASEKCPKCEELRG